MNWIHVVSDLKEYKITINRETEYIICRIFISIWKRYVLGKRIVLREIFNRLKIKMRRRKVIILFRRCYLVDFWKYCINSVLVTIRYSCKNVFHISINRTRKKHIRKGLPCRKQRNSLIYFVLKGNDVSRLKALFENPVEKILKNSFYDFSSKWD